MELADAGALDPDITSTACVLAGTPRLHQWALKHERLRIAGCDVTHDAQVLASLDNFVAVNSALEVDLLGQCNLERASGQAVSGAGGAHDFARAAALSKNGLSIIALNASYKNGVRSRIVPALDAQSVTSISRIDVGCVVTEHGSRPTRPICS